jgi:hypothetical protein
VCLGCVLSDIVTMMSPDALWLSGVRSRMLASACVGVSYEAGAVLMLMLMHMSPGAVRFSRARSSSVGVGVGVGVGYGASAVLVVMGPAVVRSLSMSSAVVAEGFVMMIVVIGISGESSGEGEEAQKESGGDVLF